MLKDSDFPWRQVGKPEKYLIVGIGYSIGTAVIGKMSPAICLVLYHYTKSSFVVGWFMFIISLATILAIAWSSNMIR